MSTHYAEADVPGIRARCLAYRAGHPAAFALLRLAAGATDVSRAALTALGDAAAADQLLASEFFAGGRLDPAVGEWLAGSLSGAEMRALHAAQGVTPRSLHARFGWPYHH